MDHDSPYALQYRTETSTYAREEGIVTVSFSMLADEWSVLEMSDQWQSFLKYVQEGRQG